MENTRFLQAHVHRSPKSEQILVLRATLDTFQKTQII